MSYVYIATYEYFYNKCIQEYENITIASNLNIAVKKSMLYLKNKWFGSKLNLMNIDYVEYNIWSGGIRLELQSERRKFVIDISEETINDEIDESPDTIISWYLKNHNSEEINGENKYIDGKRFFFVYDNEESDWPLTEYEEFLNVYNSIEGWLFNNEKKYTKKEYDFIIKRRRKNAKKYLRLWFDITFKEGKS